MSQFNPDNWLTSLQRSLSSYVSSEIDAFIQVSGNDAGLQLYEIVFDFPDASAVAKEIGFDKAIIHLVVDDIDNRKLGIGRDIAGGAEILDPGPDPDTVEEYQGRQHVVNFDVGVWATDKTGGSTARLVIYEMLDKLFGGKFSEDKCREATGGVEIRSFNGGRFITYTINDVRVFRVIDCELIVRVFSRQISEPEVIVDTEPIQDADVSIGGVSIT